MHPRTAAAAAAAAAAATATSRRSSSLARMQPKQPHLFDGSLPSRRSRPPTTTRTNARVHRRRPATPTATATAKAKAKAAAVQDRRQVLRRAAPSPMNVRLPFLLRPQHHQLPQRIKHAHQRSVYLPPPTSSLTVHRIPGTHPTTSPAHRVDPNAHIFAVTHGVRPLDVAL